MIITTTALNQLENKFTPNGLGIEIITPSTLTYNKVNTAVNNGLMPVLKEEDDSYGFYFNGLNYRQFSGSEYIVDFGGGSRYTSTNASSIMTVMQNV